MKIFLSALEASYGNIVMDALERAEIAMKWNLCSYFYLRKNTDVFRRIATHSQEIIIDSGAHSFQKGAKVDWRTYTTEYAQWIERSPFDSKTVGYFEMDVDNLIGYDENRI